MSGENWLPIAGYEGLYEVSDLGRVRSLPRVVQYGGSRRGTSATIPGGLMSPHGKLYPMVKLAKGGKKSSFNIHQLVLEAFVGPRPEGYVACHCDGDESNNAVSNLRWDTVTENNRDIVRHGNNLNANKTHCPRGHEYTPENTRRIRKHPTYRYCRQCERNRTRRGYRPDSIKALVVSPV